MWGVPDGGPHGDIHPETQDHAGPGRPAMEEYIEEVLGDDAEFVEDEKDGVTFRRGSYDVTLDHDYEEGRTYGHIERSDITLSPGVAYDTIGAVKGHYGFDVDALLDEIEYSRIILDGEPETNVRTAMYLADLPYEERKELHGGLSPEGDELRDYELFHEDTPLSHVREQYRRFLQATADDRLHQTLGAFGMGAATAAEVATGGSPLEGIVVGLLSAGWYMANSKNEGDARESFLYDLLPGDSE